MGRPPIPGGSRQLCIHLPNAELDALEAHLRSEHLGKRPWGAAKEFITARIQEFFSRRELDLAPFAEGRLQAGLFTVYGSEAALSELQRILEAPRYSAAAISMSTPERTSK